MFGPPERLPRSPIELYVRCHRIHQDRESSATWLNFGTSTIFRGRDSRNAGSALLNGTISPFRFADEVNDLVNKYLRQAAETLDPTEYERLFGIKPGETIGIVDPNIAERSNYKGRR